MSLAWWVVSILFILLLVSLYVIRNLVLKNEVQEDLLTEREELISNISSHIDDVMNRMKQIDRIGSFESDDETGYVFKEMYDMISELEEFYGSQPE